MGAGIWIQILMGKPLSPQLPWSYFHFSIHQAYLWHLESPSVPPCGFVYSKDVRDTPTLPGDQQSPSTFENNESSVLVLSSLMVTLRCHCSKWYRSAQIGWANWKEAPFWSKELALDPIQKKVFPILYLLWRLIMAESSSRESPRTHLMLTHYSVFLCQGIFLFPISHPVMLLRSDEVQKTGMAEIQRKG